MRAGGLHTHTVLPPRVEAHNTRHRTHAARHLKVLCGEQRQCLTVCPSHLHFHTTHQHTSFTTTAHPPHQHNNTVMSCYSHNTLIQPVMYMIRNSHHFADVCCFPPSFSRTFANFQGRVPCRTVSRPAERGWGWKDVDWLPRGTAITQRQGQGTPPTCFYVVKK